MDTIGLSVDRATGPSGAGVVHRSTVIIGRTREQAVLREGLDAAITGRGGLVLVGGEAGIGKTTLARDLARRAEASGVRVLTGHCYDWTNAPPYGPWLELFERVGVTSPSLAPPASLAGGQLARVTDQSALFADVRRYVADLTTLGPVLIVLEDLHWSDPASLDLLRYLGVYLGHWPALLVATYRRDELVRGHPLARHLPALIREADVIRLDLKGLDTGSYRLLVAARYRLDGADAERLVAYVDRHADGNPFFAVELLRALEEEGLLRTGDDRSSLGELARVVVPALLRQVIDGRISRLGEDTRQPLGIAALIGQEVPLDLWATVAGIGEEAVLDIVERAIEAHLMDAERDGTRVRFVHAITREALSEDIFPPRRRLWHGRIAEALAAGPNPDPDAVASHLQAAGDPRAGEWLERAGERAQRAYAWLTAAERFRAAVAYVEGIAGQDRTHRRLLARIAYLLRFFDPATALTNVDAAERLALRVGDAFMAAEIRVMRGVLLCYSGRFGAGLAADAEGIDALTALIEDETTAATPIRTWFPGVHWAGMSAGESDEVQLPIDVIRFVNCFHAWYLASAGRLDEAAELGERFADLLSTIVDAGRGSRASLAFAHHGLGIAYAALGRPDQARAVWSLSRESFRGNDHHVLVAFTALNEGRDVAVTYGAADPDARRRLAAEAEAALGRAGGALRPGVSPRLAWLDCLVLDGRWDEADRILRDHPPPGNAFFRREITAAIATLARHRGEPALAWDHIHALLPDGPATEPGDAIHQEGLFLLRLAADLCLDAGDCSTARAWCETHDRWIGWNGCRLGQADGALTWARWHEAAGEHGAARSRAAEAVALATETDQPLVRLAGHRLLGELDTAAGARALAEWHLATALDLADRCQVPFERALTALVLAETRLAFKQRGAARPLVDEARATFLHLGANPALARANALAARLIAPDVVEPYPAGLSRREVEVLRLLARQQTDKEIADALFISPHTASTHVKHVLAKLRVTNRREAAAAAADHGLA
ncbi:MAG: hypothetical protein AVDCRST_MAG73-962 [uncultured Thermomicrobiales bacterium]|uniref:HTH luxR-type domain-containing protein n=1 Tax=uncultured Thermomicrobiales bacterium TaxID=1645740 RepID=A0A6J4TTI4_9BACT|nr:MAG: hypothetical protein AVDCRST_MAG73-962 [uncultured Thermomicrobiales bacterium]